MIQPIITLLSALAISFVAAWFSITGLAALFAGAQLSVIIMASVLEVGKLVSVSWLYWNWKIANIMIKSALVSFVIILMFITSMGIFGYLSKAHIEQSSPSLHNEAKVETLQFNIDKERRIIDDAEKVLFQLDESVNTLIEYDRIRGPSGALAVRSSQKEERAELNNIIAESQKKIDTYTETQFELESDIRLYEIEIGPIKYVSELFYSSDSRENINNSIRYVILLIIFVFDPLAVILLIAANNSIKLAYESNEKSTNPTPPPNIPVQQKPQSTKPAELDDVEKHTFFDSKPSVDDIHYPKKT